MTSQLERLRALAQGDTPFAPVGGTFGAQLHEVERGRVATGTAVLRPAANFAAALVLADMTLSMAAATVLSAEQQIHTLTMRAHWAGGTVPAAPTALAGTGRLVHIDADNALSTCEVHADDGELVGTFTCRCAVLPLVGERRRGAAGAAGGAAGGDMLDAMALADLGPDGVRAVAAPALSNSVGLVQGGVLAAIVAAALESAIVAARPRLAGAPPDLDLTYVRAVPADGTTITAHAEVLHAGSRFATARAELRDAAGRPAVFASSARWAG
ncbi:PaaI family thioesterase [Pseudonocardia sp. TRM90224]|uniref:PaaI family thioesterase n=1 Tax=Pseudonocardia sp. TRM90224 TaxID=2812678 RepID=UPI001E641B7D|nr:acyl-CoA thioesterase domain-containing protein [Pseudonocardia sp. TRM90224]